MRLASRSSIGQHPRPPGRRTGTVDPDQARFEKLDVDLDIAADHGLEEAVIRSTQIGAVNSWLRNRPAAVVSAAIASLGEAPTPCANGARVRLPGLMWLIGS